MSHRSVNGKFRSAKGAIPAILLLFTVLIFHSSCARKHTAVTPPPVEIDISLDSLDIEKKYLAEGFIGNGLYRVVIVRPKGTVGGTLEEISRRGANRARVSMERSLVAEEIPSNRNTRAAILCLIEDNGTLRKTDIEHGRYDIYYFEITRQNMKQHLKRVSIQQ